MKKYINLQFISMTTALVLTLALIGCGEDRKPVTGPPHPPQQQVPHPHGQGTDIHHYEHLWSSDIYIQSESNYKHLLSDYGICRDNDKYDNSWYWGPNQCKHWRADGDLILEMASTELPTKGKVTFTAIHNNGQYRNLSFVGEFTQWEESQGFTMWTSQPITHTNRPGHGLLRIEVQNASPNQSQFQVKIYYRNRYIGFALAQKKAN